MLCIYDLPVLDTCEFLWWLHLKNQNKILNQLVQGPKKNPSL